MGRSINLEITDAKILVQKYPDHFKKSFKEVSGGLPSLGKRDKH